MSRTRRYSKRVSPVLVAVITLVILLGQRYGWFDNARQVAQTSQPGLYHVTEFLDGDTIVVDMNGSEETIRFIGVDTPETHDPRKAVQCFGKAAAGFTKNLIGTNNVRLEADALNTNRDRYNRLLRYIYLPNETLVNAEIIKQGYGFAYLSFPFTKSDEFHHYETVARNANKGLWGSCQPTQNQYGGYTSNDAP
ncbi:MAG TPA: thermonuclease family protein [Candidatus Saccharimonadales bacterium]|nr:thermonuclease family protein [Candidatus Saccharimonadales bacterium]